MNGIDGIYESQTQNVTKSITLSFKVLWIRIKPIEIVTLIKHDDSKREQQQQQQQLRG